MSQTMNPTRQSDADLLRDFSRSGSEESFRELVRRYLGLVISAAMRKTNGDHALAEDVAQLVFTDLARKARSLPRDVMLGGWLHRHTWFLASKAVRSEIRRRNRETQSIAMHNQESSDESPQWRQVAGLLDDGLLDLSEADRSALVLRYLEKRDLSSVGAGLGVSDDTAQKRVARALEKLRGWLGSRGVAIPSASVLTIWLTNQASHAAQVDLADAIASRSLNYAASVSSTGFLAVLGTIKGQLALGAAAATLAAGWPAYLWARRTSETSAPQVSTVAAAPDLILARRAAAREEESSTSASVLAPSELATRIVALTSGDFVDIEGSFEAVGMIRGLDADTLVEALKSLPSVVKDWRQRGPAATFLLNELAKTDPRRAMTFADGQDTKAVVLARWMEKDRASALSWLDEEFTSKGTDRDTRRMLILAVEKLAKTDLSASLGLAAKRVIPDTAYDTYAVMAQVADGPAARQRIYDAIHSLDEPSARLQAAKGFVHSLANQDHQATRAWLDTIPAEERQMLAGSAARPWMYVEPEKAADWWLANSANRSETMRKIVESWRSDQPNTAATWLSQQGFGAEASQALALFSEKIFSQDPVSALAWANAIPDQKLRAQAGAGLFRQWHESDPSAASEFLTNPNLKPADAEILRQALE